VLVDELVDQLFTGDSQIGRPQPAFDRAALAGLLFDFPVGQIRVHILAHAHLVAYAQPVMVLPVQGKVGGVVVDRAIVVQARAVDLQHPVLPRDLLQSPAELAHPHDILGVRPVEQRHAIHLSQTDRLTTRQQALEAGDGRLKLFFALLFFHRQLVDGNHGNLRQQKPATQSRRPSGSDFRPPAN